MTTLQLAIDLLDLINDPDTGIKADTPIYIANSEDNETVYYAINREPLLHENEEPVIINTGEIVCQ